MEYPLSPFQMLPMLIVRKTIEYLEKRASTSFDFDMDAHNKGKSVLTPLLSVSERWCTAALSSICDNCLFSFDYPCKAIEVSFPAWPASVPYSQYRKTHLVKRVVVSAVLWKDMCDGTFCDIVTRSQYENMLFPSAKSLVLNLSKVKAVKRSVDGTANSSTSSTPVAVTDIEKVTSFVRSLLRLTPAITDAIVSIRSTDDKEPNSLQLYNTLVSELCQRSVKCLRVHSGLKTRIMSIDMRVSGLVSITQGPSMACAPFAELAYLNMGTLKSLVIEVATEANWRTLIYGGTEAPAVYYYLTRLKLTVADVTYTETWAAIEDLVPFPVLSMLDICGGYPLDDDVLFRGNGDTLKSLRIPFGAIARNILIWFKVFERCGNIRMDLVHIGSVSLTDNAFLIGRVNGPIKQQMHHILKVTRRLTLSDKTSGLQLASAIYAAPRTSVLQSLVFTNLVFDLGHLIRVIAALPTLVSLTCEIRGLRSNIREIPASERPNSLRSAHYPLSENFRELRVPYTAASSADKTAIVVMQLAVLCPNFLYVDLPPKLRDAFSREIAWAMCNYSFEPYADSIRRLIYRDLNG
ncbi:hypothetical protein GGH92_003778 [Coemansia sp. RSA 2673]|nr:hypothetical protein GGH92_003778 [Coemansia sp. RSA 2673]